jgi:Flp pilus assembly protein TadG
MSARLASNRRGSAGAEMALVLPLLLVLLFGSIELGNYFRSEHILLKSVRGGAVYAARQDVIVNYNCAAGTPTVPAGIVTSTKNLVRTGELSGGTDLLPKWSDGSTSFTMNVSCHTVAAGTTLGGIYVVSGGQVPVLTVSADLPYRSVLGTLGLSGPDLRLKAAQQATATGV